MHRGKTFDDPNIGNFVFIITPLEANFSQPNEYKLTLSLQKGMQTLGTLQQSVPILSKQRKSLAHKFDASSNAITFRIISDKILNYQWTVYKQFDGGQLQEVDCMQFSIQNFWKSYVGEYARNLSNLNLRIKDEKQQKKVLQIWKEISEQSLLRTAHLRVAFSEANFRIDFQIQAKSVLDEQLEEYQKQKLLRKIRQIQRSQIRKSAITLSNCGIHDDLTNEEIYLFDKIKRSQTEEQGRLNIPFSSMPMNKNLLLQVHDRNDLKRNKSSTQLIDRRKINQDGQHSLLISSDLHRSLKKISSFEKRASAKQFEIEENLQLSSKIHHGRKTPQISHINESAASVKITIFYVVLGIVMLWLLYHLMHHHSKVQYKRN